jgi:hypothetical protein
MSHETGKIEIVGLTYKHVMFKYHQAADPQLSGRLFVCKRNPYGHWFDDYDEIVEEFGLPNPYGSAINEPGCALGEDNEAVDWRN